jgi:hypothetical protein
MFRMLNQIMLAGRPKHLPTSSLVDSRNWQKRCHDSFFKHFCKLKKCYLINFATGVTIKIRQATFLHPAPDWALSDPHRSLYFYYQKQFYFGYFVVDRG